LHNFTGLGNYSRTLLETLATYCPENDYHLFSPKPSHTPRISNFLADNPHLKVHYPENGLLKKIHPIWRSYFIKNSIEREKISIFHGLSNELPLALPTGTKGIVTIHDLIFERFPHFYPKIDRFFYHRKFKRACAQADLVVAISEQTKQDIQAFYGTSADKIQVVYQSCHPQFHNAVLKRSDTDDVLKKYQLPAQYLLYVGTVNARKNLLGVVKALKILEQNHRLNLPLVVVGDGGEYLKIVREFVEKNKLSNQIFFRPKVDFSDMPALYQRAEVFVFPSFFEGFGIPIIEALWSGIPVLTSTDSCFMEAGGGGAHYVNPNNFDEIAENLAILSTDSQRRKQLISAGHAHVEKFHEKNIAQIWAGIYSSL
jgi:glycosyltransferase involved in cell wall biosynthesis